MKVQRPGLLAGIGNFLHDLFLPVNLLSDEERNYRKRRRESLQRGAYEPKDPIEKRLASD